jgi:tripartite-type tricarboxylate transporter receptor subunit TctC
VRTGRLRAIAHSLPQRTPMLPDVPTVSETLPGYSFSAWNGLMAPKGTPAAVVSKVRAALAKTLARPEVKEGYARQGAEAVTSTPEEFRRMVASELEVTAALVKATNLQID